jgi:integrase
MAISARSHGPIVKDASERSIIPLYPLERKQLLDWILDAATTPRVLGPPDPKRLTLFLYETGMHPDVLVHPERRKLHVAENGHILWVRPKKTISDAGSLIDLEPHRRIRDWYREFLATMPVYKCEPTVVKVTRKIGGRWVQERDKKTGEFKTRLKCDCYLNLTPLVASVGESAHLPGFGARGCRHTFACRWYELTHDINVVMDKTGCSMEVALRYARLVGEKKWDAAGADME